MQVDPTEVELIASQVWELMMGTTLLPTDPSTVTADVAPTVAHVALDGASTGTVALQLSPELVRTATAVMYDLPREEVGESEMADTARELANMVGGNIKCLVEQPTSLGLPQVTTAREFFADRASPICKLAFDQGGERMQVVIYEG